VKLFLDTSVLLSASGSAKGASRFIVDEAKKRRWFLCSSHYCREETRRNLPKLGSDAEGYFERTLLRRIDWITDSLVSDWPVVFAKLKDKPVLLTAGRKRCLADARPGRFSRENREAILRDGGSDSRRLALRNAAGGETLKGARNNP
jgi:hypothetical protein